MIKTKTKKVPSSLLALIGFITLVIYLSITLLGGSVSYKDINAEEAKNLISKNSELIMIDVREPFEYENGHIPGSKLIPLGELSSELHKLNQDSSILLICRSGNRSSQAANLLVEKGFKQVYNLAGGIINWPYDIE